MIRINLLPIKRRRKAQPLPPVVIHSILIIIVTILVLVFLAMHLSGKISSMKEERTVKQAELKELNAKLEEVKNFERDNEEFQKKSEIIRQLERNQKAPLKLLEAVSIHMPEGVWITNLANKGGSVDISGIAFSNTELVKYVQNLKSSKYLTGVVLMESRQKKSGEFITYQFKLKFQLKV
jgi:type IV pilus assembly protein PilN